MKSADISIILLLYKTPPEKIQNLVNYKDFNVYILDQSNDYFTKKKILKLLPKIKYYGLSKKNKGFAKGINFLVKKVNTKFFFCTQIDVLIKKKSIIELKKPFLKRRDCIISIPNFQKQNHYKNEFDLTNKFIGAVFLADKYKFNKIGKFNEDFFFYWEDVDLSKRIKEFSKFNIYKSNNSFANHFNGTSTIITSKTEYIRYSNFKFGEYLFQHNHKKLKKIKIIREPLLRLFSILINIIFFNKAKLMINFYYLIGIINFYKFLIYKKKFKKSF